MHSGGAAIEGDGGDHLQKIKSYPLGYLLHAHFDHKNQLFNLEAKFCCTAVSLILLV